MSKKNWKLAATIASSIGLFSLVLSGCGTNNNHSSSQTSSNTSASKEGGSIVIDANGNVRDLDPALTFDTESDEIIQNVYDRLVTFKGSSSTITGMAASSWEVSPDGKVYTFHLHSGMKFSNGDSVTAQSFIDEFQRVLTKSLNSPREGYAEPIIEGSTAYYNSKASTISGLKALNPLTLQITLTQPEPFFLDVLTMDPFSAVDQKYINQVGNKAFDTKDSMGSGPFELASVSPNQYVLKKNPHYWMKDANGNQLPYLNQVTINVNNNSQLDAMDFEKGTTAFLGNTTSGIPSSAWPQFQSNPSLKKTIVQQTANATYYIGFTCTMKPFNNVLVRQAVEYAVNKDKIAKLLDNRVNVANQPLPPSLQGYVKNLDPDAAYSYNPAKAKQLLAKAGYPKGLSVSFYTANDTDSMKVADSIQNDLAQVGIKVSIVPQAFSTFLDENAEGTVQPFFNIEWLSDFPDASDFLNTLFNSNEEPVNNSTMYSNKQVDEWLNEAQTDTNQAQRNQLYGKVTNQVMKDAVWLPLYNGVLQDAEQPWVHGFIASPSLADQLQYIWVDPSHQSNS